MKKITKVLFIITILFINSPVFADTVVHLDIKTNTSSVYEGDIAVSPCDSDSDINTPDTITAYCALVQSGITSDWSGLWVNSINGILNNDNNNGVYWMWLANLNTNNTDPSSSYNLSAKQYVLNPNDRILFYYNTNPLSISVDNDKPETGQSIKLTVKELGLDSNWNPVWNNASGGKIIIGINTFDLNSEGTYSFVVPNTDIFKIKGQKNGYIDSKELTIAPVPQKVVSGGGWWPNEIPPPVPASSVFVPSSSGSSLPLLPVVEKTKFDLKKAFDFLALNQKENGSFSEDMYTDWATLALATGSHQNQTLKLVKYFGESKMTGTLLTDYERRAMALMSLGLNPYNTNGENYIEKIIKSFDGKQFGDINEDNDDIFALIVLQNAGYTENDKMITDSITFVLERQKENGSWDESADMTSAGIQALFTFSPKLNLGENLRKAKEYLKQKQQDDGGWGNVSSTAWVIHGILALLEKPEDWEKSQKSPIDYLASMQDIDGGIKDLSPASAGGAQTDENITNKIWKTAYVVSSLSGKTWNQIMQKFEKQPTTETLEIKKQKENTKEEEIKKEVIEKTKPAPKKLKLENPTKENSATVINTITESPTRIPEPEKKNWFIRMLSSFFSVF